MYLLTYLLTNNKAAPADFHTNMN